MTDPSDVWPAPLDGAPLTARAAAELALATAAREVADLARSLVAAGGGTTAHGGTVAGTARQLTALAGRVLTAAVVVERADGTTWEAIAEATGDGGPQAARSRWQPTVDRWDTAVEQAAAPTPAEEDDRPAPAESALAELDAWVVRHREPHDPDTGEHPVSAALDRMNPLHELMHLAAVRRRLAASHDGSSPPAQLLPLVERQALLEEHLAATGDPADRPEHEEAANRARAMVAHLRARTGDEDLSAG
jgi:hypothetical protein